MSWWRKEQWARDGVLASYIEETAIIIITVIIVAAVLSPKGQAP